METENGKISDSDCCFRTRNNWFRYRTGALIIEENALLAVGNAGIDFYYTVGGGVHQGETAEQCVRREVLEETGIPYEVDHLAVVCENFFKGNDIGIDGLNCQVIEFYFLMKSRGSRKLDSHSKTWDGKDEKMHWIPLDKLSETDIKPAFLRMRLDEILNEKGILHIVNDEIHG